MFVTRMFVKHLFVVKHRSEIPASNVTPQEQSGVMTAILAYPPNPPSARPRAAHGPRAHGLGVVQPAEVYRRRRLLVLAVVLSLLVGLWSFGRSAQSATTADPRSPDAIVVVVQPGDTLWAIASWLDPGADPRSLVEALSGIAGSDTLQPGQQLIIPSHLLE
ncbi:MAG: LysM peptidoglycan-binding domain-containing protein [Acidimicrobiaceae bacterium]|nr:LysM peptidoglycan-binding domain-containing protein [Acidimicrobiaceae bacterium]MYD07818.1 LysM peptidoglycan-binding domain-containing protein [Acidimicrobiaceae bacterium]MYI58910.1 LysM peptidoglycan-binding domain-containing protein [Acidimicrobiaceae bacterium]